MAVTLVGRTPLSSRGRRLVLDRRAWTLVRFFVTSREGGLDALDRLDEGLDGDDALALGRVILRDFETGDALAFPTVFRSFVATLDLDECRFCSGTGIRTDAIGRALGLADVELDPALAIIVGRDRGSCDGCGGEGKREPDVCSVEPDLTIVRGFGNFLVECGGFEVE